MENVKPIRIANQLLLFANWKLFQLSGNVANCNVANFHLLDAVTAQSQSDD